MSKLPLVVSFYTVDTPYEREVQYLRRSCEQFGVEHQIEPVASSGSWEMNCAFKPLFILQKLEQLQRPLLWVDADGVFAQKLQWLEVFSADLGVRMYNCADTDRSRIVSATVFVNNTFWAKKIVGMWAQKCLSMLQEKDRAEEVWDQDALRYVLLETEHEADFRPLPVAYGKIVGHPDDEKDCDPAVILQNQASRRYKRWILHPEERILGW